MSSPQTLTLLAKRLGAVDAMRVEELCGSVSALSKRDRRRLQWGCERILRDDRRAACREERVRAAKVLVALIPDSVDAIESLTALRSSRWRYEVHFSLFLFLGDVRTFHASGLDRRLLDLLVNYLMTVKAPTALAAWKAADTIASCWPVASSLSVLEGVARTAQFAAGRLAALSGLEELLGGAIEPGRSRIEAVIRSMCLRDRSARVRRAAGRALASIG